MVQIANSGNFTGLSVRIFKNYADSYDNSHDNSQNSTNNAQNSNNFDLTPEEKRIISELAATDAHIRAHEAAHMAAGGGLTTPANYTYQRGPDNKMYAVAGEVGINTSSGDTPEQTLQIARQIRRAALAPSDPSPQDLKVAARAASMEIMARAQIARQNLEQNNAKQNSNAMQDSSNLGQNTSNSKQNSFDTANVSANSTQNNANQENFYLQNKAKLAYTQDNANANFSEFVA